MEYKYKSEILPKLPSHSMPLLHCHYPLKSTTDNAVVQMKMAQQMA